MMHCSECQDHLSDYIDGHLSDRKRASVDQHMRECAACTVLKDDLSRIIEASASLPLHTPSPAVWERIHSQIVEESNVVAGPSAWWNRLGARRLDVSLSAQHLVAAAAAMIIVAGTIWTINLTSPGTIAPAGGSWGVFNDGSAAVTQQPLGASPLGTKMQEVQRLRGTVEEMATNVSRNRANWSPELQATFDVKLREVDAQIESLENAFESRATITLGDHLAAAYREKLHVLEEFAKAGKAPAATVQQ